MARISCPCGHRIDLDERSLQFFIIPETWFDGFINTIDEMRHLARDNDEFRSSVGRGLSGSYDRERPSITECPACGRLIMHRGVGHPASYAPDVPIEGERRPLRQMFPPAEQSLAKITQLSHRYQLSQFDLRQDLSIAELRRTVGKESHLEFGADYSRTADGKVVVSETQRKYYIYRLEDGRYLALHFAQPNDDRLVSAAMIDAKTGVRTPIWPSE